MVALKGVIVAVAAISVVGATVSSAAADPAAAGASNPQSFLFFWGADIWRYGGFLYGGSLWSPAGLDRDGFTLKILLNGGPYSYLSGSTKIDGTLLSGAALPGWRFVRGGFTLSVFAGPIVQDYRLTPNDPGARLNGFYIGGAFSAEVWYQPTASTMAALSGTVSSIGPTGSLRAAVGYRFVDPFFFGPETQELWCGNFDEFQVGAHLTGLHTGAFEWSAGGGWSLTSDHRSGPYLRLGVNTRY